MIHSMTSLGGDADGHIVMRGAIDEAAGARLGAELEERLATGCLEIHLDLSAVESVDEQGLVAVVRAWHETSARGRSLRLLDPSPEIAPLLSMSGLDTVVTRG